MSEFVFYWQQMVGRQSAGDILQKMKEKVNNVYCSNRSLIAAVQ